jgi:hypothetical protein
LDQVDIELFKKIVGEMERLADIYDRDVTELFEIFPQLSCNFNNLQKWISGNSSPRAKKWGALEDLAIEKGKDTNEYYVVADERGEDSVRERMKFLGL